MPRPNVSIHPGTEIVKVAHARWVWVALALATTFAAFSPSLDYKFVHDDRGQIAENPAVQSWKYMPKYFTDHVWAGVEPELAGNYYRPLFLLWLRINDALWGADPWGWHLTTVLLHLAVTGFVYLLGLKVLRDPFAAIAAAIIFGVHPAHIEAVAWVSGVTEPLLALPLLGSFLCFLKRKESSQQATAWQALSLLLFVLAMFIKETALVLPILILAYEYLYGTGRETAPASGAWRTRFLWEIWRAPVPFLILIPPYLAARYLALNGLSHPVTLLPLSSLLYTWPSLIWFWIKHLVWPAGLSTFYDFPTVTRPEFGNFLLPATGLVLLGLALYAVARKCRSLAFSFVWIFVPLLPVLNLRVFIRDDFAHDRYLYLPSVGLGLIIGRVLLYLPAGGPKILGLSARRVAVLGVGAACLVGSTIYQARYFADELAFYQHCVKSAPHNKYAKSNLAVVLGEQGKTAEALQLFQDVLEDDPGFGIALYNVGYTYYRLRDYEKAERHFLQAIQADPVKPQAHFYLGLARLHQGRIEEAETAVRQSIRIRDSGFGYHFALGAILRTRGDLRGALGEFRQELLFYPRQTVAAIQIQQTEAALEASKGVPAPPLPMKSK